MSLQQSANSQRRTLPGKGMESLVEYHARPGVEYHARPPALRPPVQHCSRTLARGPIAAPLPSDLNLEAPVGAQLGRPHGGRAAGWRRWPPRSTLASVLCCAIAHVQRQLLLLCYRANLVP
eukprot:jgi/Ulvmu1/8549/UM044_0083.1